MTDHEDTWMEHPTDCYCPRCGDPITHRELVAESERVIAVLMKRQAKLAETIRDQLYHLNKQDTVAQMAAEMFVHLPHYDTGMAASTADRLYRDVQKKLEIDDTIAGSISA